MSAILAQFLNHYQHYADIQTLQNRLSALSCTTDTEQLLTLYEQAIPQIEAQLWKAPEDKALWGEHHLLFHELESHITNTAKDERHHFVMVIPVADRPRHLQDCLHSLLQLCSRFYYGGQKNGVYQKVSVLIADDSKEKNNIQKNQMLAAHFTELGLITEYFGQTEQLQQLAQLSEEQRQQLRSVLGETDTTAFYHKGASIMRNISYLQLNQRTRQQAKTLFYFIDSDQTFDLMVAANTHNEQPINFFYHLDQIFSKTDAQIVTGKVVGDPPVSPAVMAGNFLEDVLGFLTEIANLDAAQDCQFHKKNTKKADDAAYHDMADLFGFTAKADDGYYPYPCPLPGAHDHRQCLIDFANQVQRFFDGEHATRKTHYCYEAALASLKPARTIYTGNYIFKAEGLAYFIPFAALKLRMAGPVLGRLIKAEIGERFLSANLPMLHTRTLEATGQSEFRPGIKKQAKRIDLSAEFERQFFGDVMLFSIEKLTNMGYPRHIPTADLIKQTLEQIEQDLHQKYETKHQLIIERLALLKALFKQPDAWWNQLSGLETAKMQLQDFIDNMSYNFGAQGKAYQQIKDVKNQQQRRSQMLAAIQTYREDRDNWQAIFE
ncbi:hypothetical protein QUF61_07905 [Candidatus Venteria ishoeyi]|uniref:hypothetical protein n=1 Tax=Candidatus Venteria ishoeyi TaxID=1899563 RepID=UPI0025A64390|nr:hypothetical protein [Candidatus Venteria ishoeyi]MDM8546404.1 hypothetical protein [Candidatus Venteria ishoeyi]